MLPDAVNPFSLWTIEEARDMVRVWYDGYRFAPDVEEAVYNPTLVLYFLKHLGRTGKYPDLMLDANLAIDQNKLTYLAREVPGQQAVMDIVQTGEPVEIPHLADRFFLSEMVDDKGHDQTYLGSFLYYFGMLTLEGRTARRTLRLTTPNLVTKSLYIDHIRDLLLADETDPRAPEMLPRALIADGNIEPLATYVEQKVFRRLSNLDYRWMNELAVKTAFLALVFSDVSHMIFSEPELDRGRADLCLLRRPDARTEALWDLLLEFKYLKLRELGLSGGELRELSPEDLLRLDPVREALADAEKQLERYRGALTGQFGELLRLRSWVVVALGFERILTREIP